MEPSEQERATECVTPAEVMAKIKAVSRQPVREGSGDEPGGNAGMRPASSVEGWGPLSPVPRLRPYSPESRAAGGVGTLVSQRKHVRGHTSRSTLVTARSGDSGRIWLLSGSGAAPERKHGKEGSGRTLHCQHLSAAPTFGPCQRCEPRWAWRRGTLAEISFPGACERGWESGGRPASTA